MRDVYRVRRKVAGPVLAVSQLGADLAILFSRRVAHVAASVRRYQQSVAATTHTHHATVHLHEHKRWHVEHVLALNTSK